MDEENISAHKLLIGAFLSSTEGAWHRPGGESVLRCSIWTLIHAVPKTERKPEHRSKPNPLSSERSKNRVRMTWIPETTALGTVTARSIVYHRCSTTQQTTDAQVAALKAAGCAAVFHSRRPSATERRRRTVVNSRQHSKPWWMTTIWWWRSWIVWTGAPKAKHVERNVSTVYQCLPCDSSR